MPAAYAAGVISVWALNTETRYGKLPLGPWRLKVTVFASVAILLYSDQTRQVLRLGGRAREAAKAS